MDAQVIEIVGRNWLMSELLKAGLEVSLPLRDRGIDLIVYEDKAKFISCPIQMKVATEASFYLDKKYEKFPNMILAYVWNLKNVNKTIAYALTYAEAFQICKKMGWTKTASWKKRGNYSTSKPAKNLIKLLEPYRMNSGKWYRKTISIVG